MLNRRDALKALFAGATTFGSVLIGEDEIQEKDTWRAESLKIGRLAEDLQPAGRAKWFEWHADTCSWTLTNSKISGELLDRPVKARTKIVVVFIESQNEWFVVGY